MKTIASKLVKIMNECNYIKKSGTNDFHKYKYATSAEVLEKINTALVKQNICSIVIPQILSNIDVTTTKGNIEHLVTVKIDIMLLDAETGETVTITGLGSGQDSGDKAVMKAQTAAIKYAYLLSMAISTGDDPEADIKTDQEKPISLNKNNINNETQICSDCNSNITSGVMNVSKMKYGKALCMKCQKKYNIA